MATTPTPNLDLARLDTNQVSAEVKHNEALNDLDTICQLTVLDRDLLVPPGAPVDGDRYLLPTIGVLTGAWVGHGGAIAAYYGGWVYSTPKEGWTIWIADEDVQCVYEGSGWRETHHIQYRRYIQHQSNIGLTTINSIGQAAPTVVANASATADDAEAPLIKYSTSGVANNKASIITPGDFRRDWLCDIVGVIKTDASIVNVRLFAGVIAAAFGIPGVSAPVTDIAAFRYSDDVDGTAFWRVGTGDAAAYTSVVTTIPIAINTRYIWRVKLRPTYAEFFMNGVLAHRAVVTLPTTAVNLMGFASMETLAAAVKAFKWGRYTVLQMS